MNQRYLAHIQCAERNTIRQSSCSRFCKALLEKGLKPIITLLHKNVTEEVALEIEKQLIKQYGRLGYEPAGTLLNKSTGESILIKNLAKYCRENRTYERKIYLEYDVIKY